MTRNLMSKFKKPHDETSKIVYDSRISQDGQEYPQFLTSSESRRDSVDRTEVYRTVAANHENQKLIMKIPILIKENAELRDKIQLLQDQLKVLKYEERNKRQSCEGRLSERQLDLHRSIRKILKQCRPMSNKQRLKRQSSKDRFKTEQIDSRHQLLESQIKRDTIYVEEEQLENSRTYGEEFRKMRKERDYCKKEKEELEIKYNQLIKERRGHGEDIDHILHKFQLTLDEKEDLMKKTKAIYEQKIQTLELKVTQLEGEVQIIKLQNDTLKEKLSSFEQRQMKQKNKTESNKVQICLPYWSFEQFPPFNNVSTYREGDQKLRFNYENSRDNIF